MNDPENPYLSVSCYAEHLRGINGAASSPVARDHLLGDEGSDSITPLSSSTLVPIIPLRRSRCFVSRFLLFLQCSSLSLGKPVEEAVNGEPPSTHRGINTIVNSVTTSHHGLTRITRKVENTERGSTSYN